MTWKRRCLSLCTAWGLACGLLLGASQALSAQLTPSPAGSSAPLPAPTDPVLTLDYRVDPQKEWQLADAVAHVGEPWQSADPVGFSLGFTDAAVWFRVRIQIRAQTPQDLLVEFGHPRLEHIEVYRKRAPIDVTSTDAAFETLRLGIAQGFTQRPVLQPNFMLPLRGEPGQVVEWYFKVHGRTALQFPVSVREREQVQREGQFISIVHGVYLGVVLALWAYNVFLLLSIRKRVYLWYVLWVTFMSGFVLTMSGLTYQWLWPNASLWNLTCLPPMLSAAVASAIAFFAAFIEIEKTHPMGKRVADGLIVVQILTLVLVIFLPYQEGIQLAITMAVLAMLGAVVVGGWLAMRRVVAAAVGLMTFAAVIPPGVIYGLSRIGWLPSSPLIEQSLQMGSMLEMLLFSIVLAWRAQAEQREAHRLQQENLAQQQRWTTELEARVADRTTELQRLNRTLAQLSRTDALTGLFNRRYLDECMDTELARSSAKAMMMAIYMIDVDHFKRVNDTHGHVVGDECLRAVAQCLLSVVRVDQDVLVRWGGEEFCLLAQVQDAYEAGQLAERLHQCVRAKPVVRANGETLQITASVGVAVGFPRLRTDLLDLQHRADEALYAAKATGRDRWEMAQDATGPGRFLS